MARPLREPPKMMQTPDNSPDEPLSPAEAREVHALCTLLQDGVIEPQQMQRLDQLLNSRRDARKLYLRYVALHQLLLENAGKQRQAESEILRQHIAMPPEGVPLAGQDRTRAPRAGRLGWEPGGFKQGALAVAASLLIASFLGTLWLSRGPQESLPPEQASQQADRPAAQPAAAEAHSPAAHVTYASPAARWKSGGRPGGQETFAAGSLLELSAGELELVFGSGSRLMLLAPVEFVIAADGGELQRGRLVASITEAGRGFTVKLPNGKVVDLGTEFGVAVDDFGVSEVNVFEGKVEAFPERGVDENQKIELTAGNGLQWSHADLIPLNADLHRFASSVVRRHSGGMAKGDSRVLADRFRASALDAGKWQALGNVSTSPDGLRMVGGAAAETPAYLISAAQFDPAQGPITITCDFYFETVDPDRTTCFSVLTRSLAERGIALPPWRGVLASCARCSFGFDAALDAGSVLAGVKLEGDRELSSISWSGFPSPQPGTPYRVVMHDDGVNVSFSVSQRDQPSIGKTVTIRSLFRGQANYVAFEGPRHGNAIIERVEVSQDLSSTPLASYNDFSSLVFDDRQQVERERRLLAEMAPADKLILEDDFESGEIDPSRWAILGDVSVVDGAVQLGLPNAEQHINTWERRPYLLTRQKLAPDAGRLTVMGRITFAENFLTGYGGSFAVMTRAHDRQGSGPGWEYSVLECGVRANFWPAAWDVRHTLEIHEKPTANSVALLAAKGFDVDPQVRSYVFRVVDDGQRVTLTIVDPARPDERMTVSTTETTLTAKGYLGFESCWGSPVLLDDLRIFQEAKSETGANSVPD
jgi:hypothetical protein